MVFSIVFLVLIVLIFVLAWHRSARKPTHAGGIVYKTVKGKTLFLIATSATNKGKWVLPKGRIEKNETPGFAATREVMEETGIQARPVKKIGTVSYKRKVKRVTVIYFLMEFQQEFGSSTEGRQVLWLTKDEAIKKLERAETKNILRKI